MTQLVDSGIEWLGLIPSHWKISRVKNEFLCLDNLRCPISAEKRNINFRLYDYYGASGVIDKIDDYNIEDTVLLIGEDGANLLLRNLPLVYKATGKFWVNNHAHILKVNADNDYDYMSYLLESGDYSLYITGSAQPKFSQSKLMNFYIVKPPLDEQKKIADYLDAKCAAIDSALDNAKKLVEKIRDYKKSLITEVVTKGLNPAAEMQDSGIEWLGLIPSHWNLIAFRYILKERNEKNNPVITKERLSLSIDKGVTLYAEKTTNLDRFKDDFEEYKIAREGDLVLNSMNMIVGAVGISPYFGCVSPAYYTYYDETENHITARYCDYLFKTKTIRKVLFGLGKGILSIERGDDRVNTCRLKISRNDLRSLKFPLPPLAEQKKIADFLDKKCAAIDENICRREKLIDKLTEYKKSLIYEVVTGKMEE